MSLPDFPERVNLCSWFLDHNLEVGRGDRTALLYGDESWTYAEVLAQVCRAARLLQELGVQRDQRVLLALSDHPEFVFFWFAAVRLGCVVSHVSPDNRADELAFYLDYTRARVLVAEERLLGASLDPLAAPWLQGVVLCRGDAARPPLPATAGPRLVRWEDVPQDDSVFVPVADTLGEDVGVLLYTSGSTGQPKAVPHRHVDFLWSDALYAQPVLGLTERDVTVSISKLFFGYATGNNLLFPFRAGATVALFPDKSTPERVLDEVTRRRATLLTAVPTVLNQLAQLPDQPGRWDTSSLRVTTSAGEALPAELYGRFRARWGCEVLDGIGSAELFHVYCTNRLGDVVPGSLGRPVPGYELKICDDEARELPSGELGSLWVKGPSMGQGYLLRTESTREHFRGAWFVSADKFRRDEEGRFWFGGRADDLLKVSGRFLSPQEVENVLLSHPAVAEVAVAGFSDRDGLTKPRAFVVLRPGVRADDALAAALQALVKEKLAPWKYPREVHFRDGLAKNDRGKIQRSALR